MAVSRHFTRSRVLRETGSTQDAARAAAGGAAGLVLTAGLQTAGRGQRGRVWEQRGGTGVAVTFVVEASGSERLSSVAGLAALEACGAALAEASPAPELGLKSPNDVLVRARAEGAWRKVAGVLVEQSDGLACIGVGINVSQARSDFSGPLEGVATSLRLEGSGASRLLVLLALVGAMDLWLGRGDAELRAAWESRLRAGADGEGGARR